MRDSKLQGILCPACQTLEENSEAVINEATLTYGQDEEGRPVAVSLGGAPDYQALAVDLLRRTEAAVLQVAHLVDESGVTMSLGDAVQIVEDGLPPGYPMPADDGVAGRRAMIARMALDILGGNS